MPPLTPLQKELFKLQDLPYRDFQSRLMPTVDKSRIIGIRTPILRAFAKEFAKTKEAEVFLQTLPHVYYEENNIHTFLLAQQKDIDILLDALDVFLPHIDNWATCDCFRANAFKKHPEKVFDAIQRWIKADDVYTVRFAIGVLLSYYLDEQFDPAHLALVASIKSDAYYINMMIAWYFATALAKQYDHAIPYLKENKLPLWVHNKTIQKAIESYRIDKETKAYLRTLKR